MKPLGVICLATLVVFAMFFYVDAADENKAVQSGTPPKDPLLDTTVSINRQNT